MALKTLPAVPTEYRFLLRWLQELRRWLHISVHAPTVSQVVFEELHAEPEKPLPGTLCFADGSDWDPCSRLAPNLVIYVSDAVGWQSVQLTCGA